MKKRIQDIKLRYDFLKKHLFNSAIFTSCNYLTFSEFIDFKLGNYIRVKKEELEDFKSGKLKIQEVNDEINEGMINCIGWAEKFCQQKNINIICVDDIAFILHLLKETKEFPKNTKWYKERSDYNTNDHTTLYELHSTIFDKTKELGYNHIKSIKVKTVDGQDFLISNNIALNEIFDTIKLGEIAKENNYKKTMRQLVKTIKKESIEDGNISMQWLIEGVNDHIPENELNNSDRLKSFLAYIGSMNDFTIIKKKIKICGEKYGFEERAGEFSLPKNFETHELKIFSYTILDYLNNFTEFQTQDNIFASNDQIRIIGEILIEAGFLDDRSMESIDDVNFLRLYTIAGFKKH